MLGWLKRPVIERAEYSQAVQHFLREEMVIETDSEKNPRFAGVFVFEQLIAKGFYDRRSAADTAAEIALSYVMGNCKGDEESRAEAEGVSILLCAFLLRVSGTDIERDRAAGFSSILKRYRREYLEPEA